jgi:hypothetical protein
MGKKTEDRDNVAKLFSPGEAQQMMLMGELESACTELQEAAHETGIASFAVLLVPVHGDPLLAFDVSGYDHLKLMGIMDFAKEHVMTKIGVTRHDLED